MGLNLDQDLLTVPNQLKSPLDFSGVIVFDIFVLRCCMCFVDSCLSIRFYGFLGDIQQTIHQALDG